MSNTTANVAVQVVMSSRMVLLSCMAIIALEMPQIAPVTVNQLSSLCCRLQMGLSEVDNIGGCCSALPALLKSFDFSSLPHQPPVPDAFAPVAYSTSTQSPTTPFSNTWGEHHNLANCITSNACPAHY